MHDDVLNDENIGWPSYVDFLASFAFVLIMFVTWSINLIAGVEREQAIHASLEKIRSQFAGEGFKAVIVGNELHISGEKKVTFVRNLAILDTTGERSLREAGKIMAANPNVKWIIVKGYSDKLKNPNDEFFNLDLSVDRAKAVLKFLWFCTNCNYKPEDIRRKLVLYGASDQEGKNLKATEQSVGVRDDRRADIILRNEDDRP